MFDMMMYDLRRFIMIDDCNRLMMIYMIGVDL